MKVILVFNEVTGHVPIILCSSYVSAGDLQDSLAYVKLLRLVVNHTFS